MDVRLLSECGERLVVDAADKYDITIEPGEFLVIEVGAVVGKAAARFEHPNVAVTAKRVYDFKHYRAGGSKFWTERAGVSHFFVVPRSAVCIVMEKGYSYIPAVINGVKVRFNVSGGGGDSWTDWLTTRVSISVNHSMNDLKRIAEVSVRGTAMEPLKVKEMDLEKEVQWNRLAARANAKLKEKVAALVEAGKGVVVKLLPGYQYIEGQAIEVRRRYRKVPMDARSWKYEETGAVKGIVIDVGCRMFAKVTQIDWHATAVACGMAV